MHDTFKEIGGFLEFERYPNARLHEDALPLNCGRSCLHYLILTRNISSIWLPYFLCDSVSALCRSKGLDIRYYHIDENFLPVNVHLQDGQWLYLVNYYGQLDNQQIKLLCRLHNNVILDSSHAYFQTPLKNIDTLFSCRKFFGVPDGGLLYSNTLQHLPLLNDTSFHRMDHILGRFEFPASDFYHLFLRCQDSFAVA